MLNRLRKFQYNKSFFDEVMRLTIITINYNNRNGLLRTVNSVINQSVKSFEWVIIDGGSTDGSRELIEQHSEQITYWVSEPDKGIYHAMNKGIKASHGDYLMFLNSGDSLYDEHTIEKVIPLLVDKDIYVGRINSVGKDNESENEQRDFSPEGILRKLTFTWIPHQASFFKRSVFDTYGMYREDQKIVSDWWAYYCSLVLGQASIEALPLLIANYDTGGVSATHRVAAIKEQEQLLHEHPCIYTYYKFYQENFDIVSALKGNKFFFFLFRIYFYLYRKILRQ